MILYRYHTVRMTYVYILSFIKGEGAAFLIVTPPVRHDVHLFFIEGLRMYYLYFFFILIILAVDTFGQRPHKLVHVFWAPHVRAVVQLDAVRIPVVPDPNDFPVLPSAESVRQDTISHLKA